jgi:hypothetical protein
MPQVYLRSVGLPWVHYEVQMTVPVSFWTDGHREFAGSPSFQVTAIPRHPYYLELPQYSTMKVTRTNYLIVVNIVRVYQRLMVFDPLTGVDIYTSFPLVQYQPFTFTFTP